MNWIEACNLSKTYIRPRTRQTLASFLSGKSQKRFVTDVFSNISFQIEKGYIYHLHGKNGAGKSTLLKILTKNFKPSSGSLVINAKVLPILTLCPIMSFNLELIKNLKYFLMINGHNPVSAEKLSLGVLEKTGFIDKGNNFLFQFSKGQLALLTLMISLQVKADVYLIDELCDCLDEDKLELVLKEINDVLKSSCSVIITSHKNIFSSEAKLICLD